jgi:hypothetical protein
LQERLWGQIKGLGALAGVLGYAYGVEVGEIKAPDDGSEGRV